MASKRRKNIGKYYRWKNGLRVKVIGVDSWGYTVCDPRNESKTWASHCKNIDESEEISEEEAKAEYALIEHNTPQVPFCSCCTWRSGHPNISIKMSLKRGRVATDESYRIEAELKKFFSKSKIIPKVGYFEDGIRLEFFDMRENDE